MLLPLHVPTCTAPALSSSQAPYLNWSVRTLSGVCGKVGLGRFSVARLPTPPILLPRFRERGTVLSLLVGVGVKDKQPARCALDQALK